MAASKIDIVITAVDNLSATVKKIEGNMMRMSSQVQRSTKEVAASATQMSTQTTASLKKMNISFSSFTVTARRLGALVGSFYAVRSAITAFAELSDTFKEFNEAMAYTNTIAQLTDENLTKLTAQVRALSVQLGKSASEMAMGLYDIYSSGFEGAQAMKVLKTATEGAIAGMTTTAIAAKGLMAVMNAYNRKTGADAVDIMDSMFKTVDKGVITFKELATEIGSVTAIAAPLGVSFDEIGAAMSEMTIRGINAAESATALEGLLRSIMKPADGAKEAIKKLNAQNKDLNFQWDIATLRSKKLKGMLEGLAEAAQGNYEAIGEIIPSIRGTRAAMVLATGDVEGFTKMLEEQADRAGSTAAAMNEANKSINRQLEISKVAWEEYKDKVGEVLANVQLKAMSALVEFAKWADKNIDKITTLAAMIVDATKVFVAYKVIVLAIAGISSVLIWFESLKVAIITLNIQMGLAIPTTATLNGMIIAMGTAAAATAIIIGSLAIGIAAVIYQNRMITKEWNAATKSALAGYDRILAKSREYTERAASDVQILQIVKENAQKQGDNRTLERAEILEENVLALKSLYIKHLQALMRDAGAEAVLQLKNEIHAQQQVVLEGMRELETAGKLIGGLRTLPEIKDKITVPEYEPFPSLGSLLGPSIDTEANKIADTIKKVEKEISEFYIELGDLANEHAEALSDETDAFEEATLKWSRYLEDINLDLTRMEDKHRKVIQGIQDDIAMENRDFSESMDDRAEKFQETMDEINQSHNDNVEDIQHQLDLELGMGLRADKEKIAELQKRLARENRDYSQSVQEKEEEREEADSRERRDNEERLADLNNRLAEERLAYEQKSADIQLALEREIVDYAKQQDEIRKKSNDTLRGIVEDYQKAFKDIFDAIRESGVPSLLAQLPGLTQEAMEASISGVEIPRNLPAEQEFVKNWGGMYGRLPTPEEVNMGVYGTTAGPTSVNVNINNPVVVNQEYIDLMTSQIQIGIGQAMQLAQNGAN